VCVTVQTTHQYSAVLKLRIQDHYWLLHVKYYSFAKMTYRLRSVVYFMALLVFRQHKLRRRFSTKAIVAFWKVRRVRRILRKSELIMCMVNYTYMYRGAQLKHKFHTCWNLTSRSTAALSPVLSPSIVLLLPSSPALSFPHGKNAFEKC